MTLYQFQEKSCNISKFLTNREKLRPPTSVLQFNTRIIKNNLNLTILVFAGPFQSSAVVSVSVFRWQFFTTCFLRTSKVWNMSHHESVWRVQSKEYYFMIATTFLTFFCCFLSKKLCFYRFLFFFLMKYQISTTKY